VIYMQIHTPPPPIPGIAPKVQAVLNRALAKNPEDRYQSSREMAVDFFVSIGMTPEAETIFEASPIKEDSAKDDSTQTEVKPKPARSRVWVGVGIFSLICLLALGAGALGLSSFLPSFTHPTGTAAPTTIDPTASVSLPVTGDLPESEGMVEVAADTYEVGTTLLTDNYHIAPQQIPLDRFWIDQYPLTNAKYQDFMAQTGTAPPEVWPGEGHGDHPVRGVTWEQAAAYCSWAKKRLPSEAEWEAAGRGSGPAPQLYPWGNDDTASGQALSLPNEDTYAVGTQSFNQSPLGVFDMVGNIWEWIGEPYSSLQEGYKILRGGRFGLPINDLAYRLAIAPGDTKYIKYAGFRCAADQVK